MAEEFNLDTINALVDSRIKGCYDTIQKEIDKYTQREPQELKIQKKPEDKPKVEYANPIDFSTSIPAVERSKSTEGKQFNPGQKKTPRPSFSITLDKFKKIVVKYGFRYERASGNEAIYGIFDYKHMSRKTICGELKPLFAGQLNINNGIARVATKYMFTKDGFFVPTMAPMEPVSTNNIGEFETLVSKLAQERDNAYSTKDNLSEGLFSRF